MTKIEVGDVLRHESGNEYTVQYMGETHGIAKITKLAAHSHLAVNPGSEMSFHHNITSSSIWTHRKVMPSIRTTYFIVWKNALFPSVADGSLEEIDDAEDGWELVTEQSNYVAVIRVNPDRTWDYVNADDEVLNP
jgi:hypothetical protein